MRTDICLETIYFPAQFQFVGNETRNRRWCAYITQGTRA